VATDRIELRGLRVVGTHGVLPEEHARAQPFELDIDIEADLAPAGRSDVLADTIDYGSVVRAVADEVAGPHADLIERLAERVIAVVFSVAGPTASRVSVTLRKVRPPVAVDLATAAVTISRPRPGLEASGVASDAGASSADPMEGVAGGESVGLAGPGPVGVAGDEAAPWAPAAEPAAGTESPGPAPRAEPAAAIRSRESALRAITGEPVLRAFLSLGSNLGDRRQYLANAIAGLPDVVAVSPVYESDPVGGPPGQGPFLNAVVELRTTLGPHALLEAARRVEADAGRVREQRWGPRTLDVDVLLVGDVTVNDDDELLVPHPRMWERPFVLVPLADLAPEIAEVPLDAIGGRVAAGLRPAGTL
jgi:dihydroneopterin aldolase / 2-amino-4-hydroxy-6-hydroxymethyldihydropteridine diphosphokinase